MVHVPLGFVSHGLEKSMSDRFVSTREDHIKLYDVQEITICWTYFSRVLQHRSSFSAFSQDLTIPHLDLSHFTLC